jgi:STE24 endopeptidase
VVGVFISLPWILRLVLALEPLPAGPLRERLEAAARRMKFRCSNILLWNTHGHVANAMVAGILPAPRYVLLTDRLVSELTPDEVEAVFGHEIGHVRHRHMLYYTGFLLAGIWVVAGLWNFAKLDTQVVKVPFTLSVAAYVFVFFGFLSRRCERQADVFGCRTMSCGRPDCPGHETVLVADGGGLCPTGIKTFISALEKVAVVNGIHRQRPGWLQSWQHSTIGRRVEFLQQVLFEPAVEKHFQRRVYFVKWALLLGLIAALLLLGYIQGWDQLNPFYTPQLPSS